MPEGRFEVGVLIAKRKLSGPWADHAWLPHAVLPAAPETRPGTKLSTGDNEEIFYAGPFELSLHVSETAHYRDNLNSGRPSVWVSLQPVAPDEYGIVTVTADPYEGEALTQGAGEIVEAVPMPPGLQEKIAAFVAAFHVERPFMKRKRDRADPEALARGGAHRPKRGEEGG
jgi:Protein of unknown function (DUF3305)